MKSIKLFFFMFFMLSINSNSIALNVNWYYSNTLNPEDVKFIREYSSGLAKKNEAVKFLLIDLNSGYKVQLNLEDLETNLKTTENKKFKSNQDMLSYCDSLFRGESCFMFTKVNENIPSIQHDLPNSSKEFRGVVKKCLRSDSKQLNILYYNGYKPYKSSKERYAARLKNSRNTGDYNGLKIDLLNEKRGNTLILRPDDKYYKFIFDSIGIFDEYELEIKCLSDSAAGIWIKQRIKFSEFDNQDDIVLYYSGEFRECILKINEKLLGWKCYEFSKKIITDEIPVMEGDDCEPCKLLCLYKKQFSVSISGVSEGYKDDKIKVSTAPVLFQCVRSSN